MRREELASLTAFQGGLRLELDREFRMYVTFTARRNHTSERSKIQRFHHIRSIPGTL
jgi:hypothetical protein